MSATLTLPISRNGVARHPALAETPAVSVLDLSLWMKDRPILRKVSLDVAARTVVGVVGPSGSGKTSFLRCLNRLHDLVAGSRVEGRVMVGGIDVYAPRVEVPELRRRIGMVFQKPIVFPASIEANVLFGVRALRVIPANDWDELVARNLRRVGLWDEVKDRLRHPATSLSLGQQQRLCMARSLAVSPELILMDEPTSSLDPKSTAGVEELIRDLRRDYTIVLVSHALDQVRRVADEVVLLCDGVMIEQAPRQRFFHDPERAETRNFLQWHTCGCHHGEDAT